MLLQIREQQNPIQEAKSYANNSSTLAMLGKYDQAIECAENVISIGKKLDDRVCDIDTRLLLLEPGIYAGFSKSRILKFLINQRILNFDQKLFIVYRICEI